MLTDQRHRRRIVIIADVAEGLGTRERQRARVGERDRQLLAPMVAPRSSATCGRTTARAARPASRASRARSNAWYSYYPGADRGDLLRRRLRRRSRDEHEQPELLPDARLLCTYPRGQPTREVVFNFGANPGSDWMLNSSEASNNANVVVTFEGSYNTARRRSLHVLDAGRLGGGLPGA